MSRTAPRAPPAGCAGVSWGCAATSHTRNHRRHACCTQCSNFRALVDIFASTYSVCMRIASCNCRPVLATGSNQAWPNTCCHHRHRRLHLPIFLLSMTCHSWGADLGGLEAAKLRLLCACARMRIRANPESSGKPLSLELMQEGHTCTSVCANIPQVPPPN